MRMEFAWATTSGGIELIADRVERCMGYPVESDVIVMLTETAVGEEAEVGDWSIVLPQQVI